MKARRGPWFAGIWVGVVPDFPGVTWFSIVVWVGVVVASGTRDLADNAGLGVVELVGPGGVPGDPDHLVPAGLVAILRNCLRRLMARSTKLRVRYRTRSKGPLRRSLLFRGMV